MAIPTKQRADISGSTLEWVRGGAGNPPIVMLNGAGTPIEGWTRVWDGLAALGTVFAYNRFGVGGSGKPADPQTGGAVLADLRALLEVAGVGPPYVLVGHSLGGLFVNLFARRHPAEVAGVVFLEATSPEDASLLEDYGSSFQRFLQSTVDLLPGPGEASALAHMTETARAVESAGGFPAIPLAVVSGGGHAPLMPRRLRSAWAFHQSRLADLSPRGRQIVARRSGHFPQVTEPRVVLQAIREVVEQAGSREAETAKGGAVYLSKPQADRGPGVLVLHSWWGLSGFFRSFCDRLAEQGFVALAPDLFDGETATTIDGARELRARSTATRREPAYRYLIRMIDALVAESTAEVVSTIGFSMGGHWACWLAQRPDLPIAATVTFYAARSGDYSGSRSRFLGHFAETDEFVSPAAVRRLERALAVAEREHVFHYYPGTGHWFFESDRPEAYEPAAASLAWDRTLEFLRERGLEK